MKTTFLQSTSVLLGSLALATSLTVAAGDNNTSHSEKRSADKYWSEFKQDSKQNWKDTKEAFKDGWIESKLETALILNEHLDALDIDISVDNNVASLSGEVNTDIEKELAENIALGIEGIDSVKNNIKVIPRQTSSAQKPLPHERSFSQYVSDVSTTAAIKTELLASKNVEGLKIDVDTYNNVVTLSGNVDTGAQKDLAQAIASKQHDVVDVVNKLVVKS